MSLVPLVVDDVPRLRSAHLEEPIDNQSPIEQAFALHAADPVCRRAVLKKTAKKVLLMFDLTKNFVAVLEDRGKGAERSLEENVDVVVPEFRRIGAVVDEGARMMLGMCATPSGDR